MEIKFKLIIKAEKLSENIFSDFLEKAMTGVLGLSKYDYKEPLKRQLDIDNINEAKQLFDYYGNIIFKGKNKSWITIDSYKEGIGWLSGSLTISKNIVNIVDHLKLFLESYNNNQIIYGKICTESEYNLKHKVITEWAYGWEGTSINSFMKFLPGIYWYTIFGKELVESIGKDKFKNLPNVIYTEPKNGCVAFHLDEPIDSEDLETRITKEKEIAKIIGQNYFFDRDSDIESFSHPKQFLDFLKSLEK